MALPVPKAQRVLKDCWVLQVLRVRMALQVFKVHLVLKARKD